MGLHSPVVLDQEFATGRAFGARGTPSAVLIDGEGRIASPLAVGAPNVIALAKGEAPTPAGSPENGAAPAPPKVGDPAPKLRLPDLNGTTVNLAANRGTSTLVLFWNPGCGFCQRMLDDLKAWEAKPPKGAPKLLVVSTGDAATNRAMGLHSTVVLTRSLRRARRSARAAPPLPCWSTRRATSPRSWRSAHTLCSPSPGSGGTRPSRRTCSRAGAPGWGGRAPRTAAPADASGPSAFRPRRRVAGARRHAVPITRGGAACRGECRGLRRARTSSMVSMSIWGWRLRSEESRPQASSRMGYASSTTSVTSRASQSPLLPPVGEPWQELGLGSHTTTRHDGSPASSAWNSHRCLRLPGQLVTG